MGKRHYFKFLSISNLSLKTALTEHGFRGKVPKKVVQRRKTGPVLLLTVFVLPNSVWQILWRARS